MNKNKYGNEEFLYEIMMMMERRMKMTVSWTSSPTSKTYKINKEKFL